MEPAPDLSNAFSNPDRVNVNFSEHVIGAGSSDQKRESTGQLSSKYFSQLGLLYYWPISTTPATGETRTPDPADRFSCPGAGLHGGVNSTSGLRALRSYRARSIKAIAMSRSKRPAQGKLQFSTTLIKQMMYEASEEVVRNSI